MTPAHERKAKERKAKQAAGLVRVEAWVPRMVAQSFRVMAESQTRNYLLTLEAAQSPKVTGDT